MALDIPNSKEIFNQQDVRETAVSDTAPTYITQADESANLANSRQLAINTDDMDLTDGGAGTTITVSLKNKTSYWSCPGINFGNKYTLTDLDFNTNGSIDDNGAGTMNSIAPVFLPHGAVVTAAIVDGNTTAGTSWTLQRTTIAAATNSTLAGADIGVEDTTISNATIDNNLYSYFLLNPSMEGTIYGARITYTTDYD